MVTVATSTAATATAYANQRKVDRCQNGVLWSMFWDGTSTTTDAMEFWYSTDDGATWTAGPGFGFAGTGTTYVPSASLSIDLDDYAHVVYKDRHDGVTYYRRGTPNAGRTAWTWSAAVQVSASLNLYYPDIVAHREGTGWRAHVVASLAGALPANYASYYPVTITSGGTISVGASTIIGGNYDVDVHTFPSIDFNHIGDGKTVAGSTPHLYVAWSAGATGSGKGIRFRKATYSAGSWTWGTERGLVEDKFAHSGLISSVFDGAQCTVAYVPSTATSTVNVRDRDAADTTTTQRNPTTLSDGVVQAVSVSYDSDRDIHLWVVGATSSDVKRSVFDRSEGTWAAWSTVVTADARPGTLTLKRGYAGVAVDGVFTDAAASPYNVVYERLDVNRAPLSSTWNTVDNQARDVNAALTLDWNFRDADFGDTQGSYALRRQIGDGSYEYWNAGTSGWGVSEVENATSTTEVTVPSGWGADADANHKFAVKTWDVGGLAGVFSSELTVVPSAKDNPSITVPADAGSVPVDSLTVEWTVATQTLYRARLLSSVDVVLESSGWVTSAALSHTFGFVLENSTGYKVEVATRNDEGLTSDADVHTFSVAYTAPAVPSLVVYGSDGLGLVVVEVTNPVPSGTEPDVVSNDVWVRVASGGQRDGVRTVADGGVRVGVGVVVGGVFDDRAVASGVEYEYRVRAFGDNGTSSWSVWVGVTESLSDTYYGGGYAV